MKIKLLILCYTLLSQVALCQENLKEYQALIDKGWKLRYVGNYRSAAVAYSSAIKLAGNTSRFIDIHRAAFLWALVNRPDSAFYHLNIIGTVDINFEDFVRVATDEDYASIKGDPRWAAVMDKIFNNAARKFNTLVKASKGNVPPAVRFNAATALMIQHKPDSAFHQLYILSSSNELTFEYVNNILTSEILAPLQKDKRWQQFQDKMFFTLSRKYLSATAFSNTAKKIVIDEGHHNLHNVKGTYAALAGVLNKRGLTVSGHAGQFTSSSLVNANILIIANPFPDVRDSLVRRAAAAKEPFRWSAAAARTAYLESEVAVIQNWVNKGGSLLLILDHAPHGMTGGLIAAAFGVECRNVATYDRFHRDPAIDTLNASTILFTRSKGLIGKHPILQGVDSVTTYTGESLLGPVLSDALLLLPPTATDQDWESSTKKNRYRPATGRVQGVALKYGRGRVVVLGEAFMTNSEATSRPDRGNWQMTLNILRWLAREKME